MTDDSNIPARTRRLIRRAARQHNASYKAALEVFNEGAGVNAAELGRKMADRKAEKAKGLNTSRAAIMAGMPKPRAKRREEVLSVERQRIAERKAAKVEKAIQDAVREVNEGPPIRKDDAEQRIEKLEALVASLQK